MKTLYIAILGFLLLGGISSAQIAAGTSVQITIMGVPVEEKAKVDALYPVSESGTVNLPLLGRIRAAGMKPETLATSIQNAYRNAEIYTNPTIQVISTAEGGGVEAQMVHIGGQVRKTGPVAFTKNLTLYQAIQSAGGATEFGTLKRVKLFRNGKTQTFDATEPKNMAFRLRPDDTLQVPQKNWLGQ